MLFRLHGQLIAETAGLIEPFTQEAAGLHEKVAAAHGGVEHLELQDQRRLRVVPGAAFRQQHTQGFLHQEAHKRVRGVVAAAGLTAQAHPQEEAIGGDLFDELHLGLAA